MQFKKPKFWDKNRQTIFSLILFPLSIIVNFVAKLKRLKKGKKFNNNSILSHPCIIIETPVATPATTSHGQPGHDAMMAGAATRESFLPQPSPFPTSPLI